MNGVYQWKRKYIQREGLESSHDLNLLRLSGTYTFRLPNPQTEAFLPKPNLNSPSTKKRDAAGEERMQKLR